MSHSIKWVFITIVIISFLKCTEDENLDGNCGDPKPLNIADINAAVWSFDDEGRITTMRSSDPKKTYIQFTPTLEAHLILPEINFNSNIIPQALATPPCPTPFITDYLTNLTVITTDSVFTIDSVYESGTNINSLFLIYSAYTDSISIDSTIKLEKPAFRYGSTSILNGLEQYYFQVAN